jgi:asparagine synthase (glutamine-hydrolysing)
MPDFLWHLEEPFMSTSMYAQWNVMRHVAQSGVKVVLDGQGGDELLAGYQRYPSFYLYDLLRRGQIATTLNESRALRDISNMRVASTFSLVAYLSTPRWAKAHISRLGAYLNGSKASQVLQADFRQRFADRKKNLADDARTRFRHSLAQRQYSDVTKFMLPSLLRYEDRNSMAFSVESRTPFLDYRLVEFIFSLPANFRIRNGWRKWILREAMQDTLPEKVRWRRDKMGFPTPETAWLQAAKVRIQELFADRDLRSRPYLDSKEILIRLDAEFEAPRPGSTQLWRWINLELWMRRFDLG